LDGNKIHVQAPSEVVFLCGGPFGDISEPTPLSLRDAFIKILDYPPLRDRILIQAEDVTKKYSFFDFYNNILEFETDLAQIVELIILFCESEGSLAELGAFAMIDEIVERLFLIVRQEHWNKASFIRLGPLRRVEFKIGRKAIYVIQDDDLGLKGRDASGVNKAALGELLKESLTLRFEKPREPTTFDANRSGHVIKLIVGLIQDYGALNVEEIESLLDLLNVAKARTAIEGYLLCAEAVEWLKKISKGPADYFIATKTKSYAATITLKETAQVKNRMRRRALIRDYWKKNDIPRHNSITKVFGEEDGK
jgi:hypothetical protein